MKKLRPLFIIVLLPLLFSACATNPLTGRTTMALVSNRELFPMAFAQYRQFLAESTVVTNTADARMIQRVGERIATAAQLWLSAEGYGSYMDDYEWEFALIQDDTVNAWAMPGGKIAFYTGILPVTQTEAGVAVVMGHEIAHVLLNHGQQRMSGSLLQELGALGLTLATLNMSPESQALTMTAYGVGSTLFGTLPFSRQHEFEADEYGLILMAIAGYHPAEGAAFWQRMSSYGGASVPQFLSTHPSDSNRIQNLHRLIPVALAKAAEFGVHY